MKPKSLRSALLLGVAGLLLAAPSALANDKQRKEHPGRLPDQCPIALRTTPDGTNQYYEPVCACDPYSDPSCCDPNNPYSYCYNPCDPTDPYSYCYEPPPPPPPPPPPAPTGFTVQVFSSAKSMAELAPIIDAENAAYYEANGYEPPPSSSSMSTARLTCAVSNGDFDGDGLVGAADTFPATLGPYIADFPQIGLGFRGVLTADVAINVSSSTKEVVNLVTVDNTSYTRTRSSTDSMEIKSEYKSSISSSTEVEANLDIAKLLKADFSGVSGKVTKKFSSKNQFDFSTSFARSMKDEVIRKVVSEVNNSITRVTTTNTSFDEKAGRIRTTFVIQNRSTTPRNLRVKNLNFLVMIHDPVTGQDRTFARAVQLSSHNIVIGWGSTNNTYEDSLVIEGINTNDMLGALGQGGSIEVIAARGYILEDADTNEVLNNVINNVSRNTALLTVYAGGSDAPIKWHVSTRTPDAYCTTVQEFLVNAFGTDNIAFRRDSLNRLVVDRIHGKLARHADRDFNTLTETEKNEYGKWVVGMYGDPNRHPFMDDNIDLSSTYVFSPEDQVYLYYLSREDYEPTSGPLKVDYFDDDIGIIREKGMSCPQGTEPVTIHMDDENNDNRTQSFGWTGDIRKSHSNTFFEFCKVDGEKFRRLTTSTSYQYHYAVLKMDVNCPAGAVPFERYFDNEDGSSPNNYNSGNIWPSEQGHNTTLRFCLFRHDPSRADRNYGVQHMMSFPDLGAPYGVFVGPGFDSQFLRSNQRGHHHTDDEDGSNENGYGPYGAPYLGDAQRIVTPGGNTDLHTGKVR